jgi:PD-(D/E)XK endonuclease
MTKPIITDHPVDVGHRAEAAILAELAQRGYRVLLPFGVNQRYDLVLWLRRTDISVSRLVALRQNASMVYLRRRRRKVR